MELESIMRFVRRNKFTLLAIMILVVLVVVGVQIKKIFVPDEGKAAYGNRLEGIDNFKINDDVFKEIESNLKQNERVSNVEFKKHGKIINVIITVSDDMSIGDAKGVANSIVGMFKNNELSFYSLQVFLKKNDVNQNNFPIIGYKGPETAEIQYTKDK